MAKHTMDYPTTYKNSPTTSSSTATAATTNSKQMNSHHLHSPNDDDDENNDANCCAGASLLDQSSPSSSDSNKCDSTNNNNKVNQVINNNNSGIQEENLEEVAEKSPLLIHNNKMKQQQQQQAEEERHVQFNSDKIKNFNSASAAAAKTGDGDGDSPRHSISSSSSSSSSDDTLEYSEARPPDGGWGWVVVMAAFVVNLIADGITFSFGVIFVEFLKYFGENRSTTAWVGSLFMAMPLLSGPIASFLTDRYGCRKVTIFGSILASTGFIISSRANSMMVLCITFGILAGFGLSLCYVASVVIVAYYFDKKRSFATGLAVCGSGIGTFIFAPFIQYLLQEYGWRGTTLILAGLFLNLAVCGALMRDLPWTSKKLKSAAEERKRNRNLKRKNKGGSSADSFSVSNSTNTASVLQPIAEVPDENLDEVNPDRLCSSLVNLPTYVRNGEKVPIEVIELLSQHKNVYNVLLANYPSLLTPSRSFSDSGRLNEAHMMKHQHNLQSPTQTTQPGGQDAAYVWWLKRNQMTPPRLNHNKKLPTASFLKDLRVHRLSVTYRGAMLNINRYRLRASSCPDIYRNSMTTIAKEKGQWYAGLWDFWDLLVDMFDFSHFSDPKFLLFAISNFLLYTWYDVPYVYITDNATTLGYTEEDASILISVIGIINMLGEVILGWAGDRPWANAGMIYAICMGLCGAVTAMVPLFQDYWSMCAISGAFGFFIAANYSLTCIILVELITLDRFTNAYGLLLLVQGVANLIGPPLGGWLCDITNNYDLSFYLAGLFIALSGLLLIILPILNRYKKFMRQSSSSNEENSVDCENCTEPTKLSNFINSCLSKTVQKQNPSGASHI